MMTWARWAWREAAVVLVTAAVMCQARPAIADDARERAKALFQEGRAALAEGDLDRACRNLAESLDLDERVGTAASLADCQERRGHLPAALELWRRSAALAAEMRDDREAVAQERAAALEGRVPRLAVRLERGAPRGSEISIRTHPGAVWRPIAGGTVARVGPGKAQLRVRARGHEDRHADLELAEGETREIELAAGPRRAPPPSAPPGPSSPDAEEADGPSPLQVAGYAVGASGIVGVGIGAILGLISISKRDASEPHCNAANVCDAEGVELRDDGIALGDAATAAFVLGGAALATGITLVVLAPSSSPTAPSVGLAGTGASLRAPW
jgi:tetratricopeptide (TPR) repeat protein